MTNATDNATTTTNPPIKAILALSIIIKFDFSSILLIIIDLPSDQTISINFK